MFVLMETAVDGVRVSFSLAMLGLATFWDLRSREINDLLWIAFGGIAAVLIFFGADMSHTLASVGISLIIAPVVIIIWRFGFFGGADAFGLIVLSALSTDLSFTNGFITPFTTLTNSAILSVAPIFFNISRNLVSLARHENIFEGLEKESQRNKLIALFIGHRTKNPRFSFSIEKREGTLKKLDFSLKNADDADFCTTSDTWVTPGIPYMIYITSGFVVQLVYGDMIFNFFKAFH